MLVGGNCSFLFGLKTVFVTICLFTSSAILLKYRLVEFGRGPLLDATSPTILKETKEEPEKINVIANKTIANEAIAYKTITDKTIANQPSIAKNTPKADYPLASTQVTRSTHPHLWAAWTVDKLNLNSTVQDQNSKLPTIIAQLRGEMGNNLCVLVHARGLQYMLLEHYGLETNLLLRHQTRDDGRDVSKWLSASRNVQELFPALRKWDFSHGGNWTEWNERVSQQQSWLDIQQLSTLNLINAAERKQIDKCMQLFQQLLQSPERPTIVESSSNANQISLPYLYSQNLGFFFVDKYYDEIRELFQFDRRSCKQVPDPDESVFHFRNFLGEMGEYTPGGYEETSPNQTATLLFGHLKPGDKVAITTRFEDNEYTQAQVRALEARGLKVRVIAGQTVAQDFCFLSTTQKELVGVAQSTYSSWAAILGNMQVARFYRMDSMAARKRAGANWKSGLQHFAESKYSNPKLQYMRHEVYKSEEEEESEEGEERT